ncbi:VOC family protein [Aurantimonas sp. A2-1-M11]|uniref:VOC family protein n=1 Tax=Aurantimonas sp. A2-1-M11 TaxID=3113712 RepID=UPI002F927875
MSHPIGGLDHALILVDAIAGAAAAFEAMGFTISPMGLHSEAKGSANHTIMFQDDYLEILGILRPTPLNQERREALACGGPGLHGLAMRVGDAKAAETAFAALGIATGAYSQFTRPVEESSEAGGIARFATLTFDRSEVPFGLAFMCEHRTPELVWRPSLSEHANTAIGIGQVVAIRDEPVADAARLARVFGFDLQEEGAGSCVLSGRNGGASIALLSPERFGARFGDVLPASAPYAACRIRVRRIEAARHALRVGSVPFVEGSASLAVPPTGDTGVVIEFVQA